MLLNRFCTHCNVRCDKQVYWRPVNGVEMPFCSITHWMHYRRAKGGDLHAQKALADQNETGETAGQVPSTAFIKDHHEVGPVTEAQMTFDAFRSLW